MSISSKGKYALKLLLDLAIYGVEKPVTIKDIAKRQDISEKYLEQIVTTLRVAGYVKGIRGSNGGYMLTMKPEKYTVAMILKATEGSISPMSCVGDDASSCENRASCVTIRIWERLDTAISDVLEGITLLDMKEWQNELIDNYVI